MLIIKGCFGLTENDQGKFSCEKFDINEFHFVCVRIYNNEGWGEEKLLCHPEKVETFLSA